MLGRKKQVKKYRPTPRKPEPYGSTHHSHDPSHGHEHGSEHGHNHGHSHSSHEEKVINSKQLDEAYRLSYKVHEKLEELSKHADHGSGLQPAETHANICYRILEEIQPTHNIAHTHVNIKKLNDAFHQASGLLSTLAKYKHKNEEIHLLLREVRSLKSHLDDLVNITIPSHSD